MSLPEYLKNALDTGEGSDFSIFVLDANGNKIEKRVHKFIIRRCPYFSALFDLQGKEAKDGSVTFDNIEIDTLGHVLRYIYTEELPEMTIDQALTVASAADYLQLASLTTTAINKWKELFIDTENKLDAFRLFVASQLDVDLGFWRNVMEQVLVEMHKVTAEFNIIAESSSFVEFLICFFGASHPYFSADLLAEWTEWAIENAIDLIEEEVTKRTKLAEDLMGEIAFLALSLRTLAKLSESPAFPQLYMLKKIQQRARLPDRPVNGEVTYNITVKTNRVIELQHETGGVVFFVRAFNSKSEDERGIVWELLALPEGCQVTVKLMHLGGADSTWPSSGWVGRSKRPLTEFMKDGKISFRIILANETTTNLSGEVNNASNNEKYTYSLSYDEDKELEL